MTNEELDAATKGWRTHPDPQHEETFADTERKLREIITTLRAQLARREEMHDCAMKERDDTTLYADELKARADRAEQRVATLEAALAAPEVMHEDAPAAIVGEIGNQIHNLGCELQNDEDVSLRLSDLACRCWDAAKLFPTDRTALDRMLAEAKAEALQGPWSDKPDDLTDAVVKAHPVFTKKYDTYTHALELVSNRHSKGALVALVNYLLQQSDESREKEPAHE